MAMLMRGCSAVSAIRRASASAEVSSSRSDAGAPSTVSSVRSTRLGDLEEADAPVEEGRDGDLVGGVEGAGIGPAAHSRLAGQGQERERVRVGRVKLEGQTGREVEGRHRRGGALGIGERVGDGHAHVRVAEVRERRAVPEADDRVHDRGRMDDDLDLLVRHAEEEMRLDQLESFVGERRGVDGDLRAHVPGRVRERLRRGHAGQLLAALSPEGAARRGQHQGFDCCGRSVFQALEQGGVLAVDRQQPASSPLPRVQRQRACCDEALLVREREIGAALERPQRRGQAREADDGVEDDVRLGALEQLDEVAADLRQRREAVDRLRAGGGGDELEFWMCVDDLERLPADRTGGAQEGNALHPPSVRTSRR